MNGAPQDTELATRLVRAAVEMHGQRDARVVARLTAGLISDLVPRADGVAVTFRLPEPDAFAVLGVLGYPHFPTTMLLPADSSPATSFGAPIHADTAEAVAALFLTEDPENTHRFAQVARNHGSPWRWVAGEPITLAGVLLGFLWTEHWSTPHGLSSEDRHTLHLCAHVAAIAFADVHEVTLYGPGGGDRVVHLHDEGAANSAGPLHEPPGLLPGTTHETDLSPREIDVLRLVAMGYTSAQIAERLFISKNTVRVHRSHVLRKLGVDSSVSAITEARRCGILD